MLRLPDNLLTGTQDGGQSAAGGEVPNLPGTTAITLPNEGDHGGEPVEALLAAKDGDLVLAATATGRYHVWQRAAGELW